MKELASNKEWKKWGEVDPLYGVATWKGKERNGADPWTDDEFYKLGESDWNDFVTHWERYGVNKESCLEIGCGAGRITMHLAKYFDQVHALDVSEKMIEYAQEHIPESNVIYHLSTGTNIPLPDQSVTSVFSTHVFQHFDSSSVAEIYFTEISRVLKMNGTLMIHIPIYQWPSTGKIFTYIYKIRELWRNINAKGKRLLMEYGIGKPIMRVLCYPMEYFYKEFPKYGFNDIEITTFITKSNYCKHSFLFAGKKL